MQPLRQPSRLHIGSHQFAALHRAAGPPVGCSPRLRPARLHHALHQHLRQHQHQHQHQRQQQQQQQQQHSRADAEHWWRQDHPPPPPPPLPQPQPQPRLPPMWITSPLPALQGLVLNQNPFLLSGPPKADSDTGSMVVRLHLDQVRKPPGKQQQQHLKDLYSMLLREGVGDPAALPWAAVQQHSADLRVLEVAVQDTLAARQAARAAVAAGTVSAHGYDIPVSWGRCTAPPPGCIALVIHQLPVQFARKDCVAILLAAAGQEGEVVSEFLGGSHLTGDAALFHPAADAVVAWVRPPPEDPLLTCLPASFEVLGGPTAKIEVPGRPSLAPELWEHLTQRAIAARARVEQVASQYSRDLQGLQDVIEQLQQQQQRHRAQQQQQQQQSEQQHQHQQQPEQQQHHPWSQREYGLPESLDDAPPLQQRQEQQQHQWGVQRPGGQLHPPGDAEGGGGMEWDASPAPCLSPTPESAWLEQQQQQQWEQQWQQQQGHQPQRPGGQLLATAGRTEDAHMEEVDPGLGPLQQQNQQHQQQQHHTHSVLLPSDPLLQDPWALEQSEQMLQTLDQLAEEAPDPSVCVMSASAQQRLRHQYIAAFHAQLRQQQPVDQAAERSWLRLQLGIPALSYGCSDSDEEEPGPSHTQQGSAGPGAGAQQQQQQQRQQPAPPAPRRSSRPNLGRMSAAYAATHGPVAGPSRGAPSERGGRGGRENSSQPRSQQPLPATPTAPAAPKPRKKGHRGRRAP